MDEYLQNNLKDIIKQAIWDPYTLVLSTKEMAQEFIDCFKDLIKEAYPLV